MSNETKILTDTPRLVELRQEFRELCERENQLVEQLAHVRQLKKQIASEVFSAERGDDLTPKPKPCPMCFGTNLRLVDKLDGWHVRCVDCGTHTDNGTESDRRQAMERWNNIPRP